jgi:DNA-binding NarL/FixJ family response regulator
MGIGSMRTTRPPPLKGAHLLPEPARARPPQEFQIARFVAQALSNREVAAQLFLSPRAVDFHLRNVFTKLGIASRTELATLQLDAHAPARPASADEAPAR